MVAIKFRKHEVKKPKAITSQKLKASERTLQKQREQMPLLFDWVSSQQPTAQERVNSFYSAREQSILNERNHIAASWKRSRQHLRTLPIAKQNKLIEDWNNSGIPKTHEYFADFLSSRIPSFKKETTNIIQQMMEDLRQKRLQELGFYK